MQEAILRQPTRRACRVFRDLRFKNRKHETEFLVQAEKHVDRVYHLLDFPLPSDPTQSDFRPRRPRPTPPLSEPRPLTQSEHDWAYAKRAPDCGLSRAGQARSSLLRAFDGFHASTDVME